MDKKYIEREKTFNKNEYSRQYDKNHYKTLGYKCKLTDIDKIEDYAARNGIDTNSMLIHKCVMYCIDNNIDISNDM